MLLKHRNAYYNQIQYLFSRLGNRLAQSLKWGRKDSSEIFIDAEILLAYLRILGSYSVPANAVIIECGAVSTLDVESIRLSLISETISSWTNDGVEYTASEVASELASHINTNYASRTTTHSAYSVDEVVVVYTYKDSAKYDYTFSSLNSSITTEPLISSIPNLEENLLTNQNCITYSQLCKIINHSFVLLNKYKSLPAATVEII